MADDAAASAPRGLRANREAKAPASACGVAIIENRSVHPRDRREAARLSRYSWPAMADRLSLTPRKARRLVSAVVNVDETIAHVDRSLNDFDGVLLEFKSLLVDFAAVLERFNETVGRVDGTVDRVGVITTELGEVVAEMGGIVETFSPALSLNDQFRRQLDKLRSLAGSPEGDTEPRQ